MEPDLVIRGDVARCPCLYVWRRDGLALYVGLGRHGMSRALVRGHRVLDIRPTDTLEVYLFPGLSSAELHKEEARMIDRFEPSLNRWRRQYMYEHRPEPERAPVDHYPHFKR